MLNCLSIVGTRPEAIKMAPVIKELARHPDRIRSVVCSTGQHRQMLDQVFKLFAIRPDFELNVMQTNQTLSQLTAALFTALDDVVKQTRPTCILAQGDTTTVMVSSWVAYYHRIEFGHVEAGLRTGDRYRPFPEEMNRCVADQLSHYLFAPTEHSRQNLLREGFPANRISVTGNTVIDALLEVASRPYDWASGPLSQLPLSKRLVLITAHRRESFGEPFRDLCCAIRQLAQTFQNDGVHFVYPVHLNPNVRQPVHELLSNIPNVTLIEPVDYLSLVQLMKRATLILTDSGGIQEEAPGLKVPVLVMRETTERPEGIEAGVVRLVGTSQENIVNETTRLLRDATERDQMAKGVNPYGDGRAAQRIVDRLLQDYSA
jgi:UDP-N-acetylglucosamine 2-epimerase (non-hydrolysing)